MTQDDLQIPQNVVTINAQLHWRLQFVESTIQLQAKTVVIAARLHQPGRVPGRHVVICKGSNNIPWIMIMTTVRRHVANLRPIVVTVTAWLRWHHELWEPPHTGTPMPYWYTYANSFEYKYTKCRTIPIQYGNNIRLIHFESRLGG